MKDVLKKPPFLIENRKETEFLTNFFVFLTHKLEVAITAD